MPAVKNVAGSPLEGKVIQSLAAGNSHFCALAEARVYCWGENTHGQLGDGTTTGSDLPVAVDTSGVLLNKTITAMSAGYLSTCVIADGSAYCWGMNTNYQLGIGADTSDQLTPVAVDTSGVLAGKVISSVAVTNSRGCAIAAGKAYCWGSATGDSAIPTSGVPVAVNTSGVLAGKTVTDVSLTLWTSCLVASGKAYCWGNNSNGELGNGSTTFDYDPVAVNTSGVLAGRTVTEISVKSETVCAIADGKAFCWGKGNAGLLGNGTPSLYSAIPTEVDTSGVLQNKTVSSIVTGVNHACILAQTRAYCWGGGGSNQLGNYSVSATTGFSAVPVAVIGYKPYIDNISFSTDEQNRKILNVNGQALVSPDFVASLALYESLVSLNGDPLGFCTTSVYTSSLLTSVNISPELFSDTAPCYVVFTEAGTSYGTTYERYQIVVPDDFDENASGDVKIKDVPLYAFNENSQGSPSLILNPPAGFDVVDQNNTDLSEDGTAQNQSLVTLQTAQGEPVAEASVDTSDDRDWSSVIAGFDKQNHKSFVHGLSTAPGVQGGLFSLFVPKDPNDNTVVVCAGAASLAAVSRDCIGAVSLNAQSSGVTVETIGADQYWKIGGLTGTGAISFYLANDQLAATGQSMTPYIVGVAVLLLLSMTVLLAHPKLVRRR